LSYWERFSRSEHDLSRQNLALLENFMAATHGGVLGYEANAGEYKPQLDGTENRPALEWGLETLQSAICQVTTELVQSLDTGSFPLADFQEMTARLLRLFYCSPSRQEALVWGSFRHSDDQIGSQLERLIPVWNTPQVISALMNPKERPPYWWLQGSQAVQACFPLSVYLRLRAFKQRFFD
jgi:hypothetical protein